MARSNNISMADKLAAAAEQNSKPPVAAGTKPVVVDKNAAPLPSAPKPEDGGVVTPAVTPQAPAPVAPEAVTPVETPAAPAVSPEVPKPE